ncbi:MAG: 1-aminocyclopropane-1-carboxylate deaminase [Arcobacteraceae bacterium]|jgi:1-aminocyclopropane-1-carboxylate deaminase/D-cysteine desulfhydrase-like pyridoxal-dependent ACC family enzyme|nr:1-aminocyclopropane-1-carboxylate deaminase [Arcobacteraceae bacterium]
MKIINSPVQKVNFNTFEIFIKRDDLLHHDFSGNKARKFLYFLEHDFPSIKKVISHGSNQSNAMYSLSVLCRLKKWEFIYYTDHVSGFLAQNPMGNYKNALDNGMRLIQGKCVPEKFEEDTLFIQEGGALKEAEFGIKKLALEIEEFAQTHRLDELEIFLPSGTGTTALFLQKNLPFKVLTCACVGDETYLKKQFELLEKEPMTFPTILNRDKKYHFGKLYKEFYCMYKNLKEQTHIEFDLLYDPLGFIVLQNYLRNNPYKKILYVHQGGILGNVTMLQRYARKSYF